MFPVTRFAGCLTTAREFSSRPEVRALLRGPRDLPERLLHPLRRRRARHRLAAHPARSLLFVCLGNICRSPYAAAAFLRALPASQRDGFRVRSAGFIGPDRPSPPQAIAAAARAGLDLSAHRSVLLTPESVRDADLVVVMSADQCAALRARVGRVHPMLLVLGDLDPRPIARRTVHDPWGDTDDAFDASYARVERCTRELARILTAAPDHLHGPAADPSRAGAALPEYSIHR